MKTLEKGKLLVASHNQGKIKEMIDLLGPFGFEVVSAGDLGLPEPDETGTTFEENAYIKAFAAAKATGLWRFPMIPASASMRLAAIPASTRPIGRNCPMASATSPMAWKRLKTALQQAVPMRLKIAAAASFLSSALPGRMAKPNYYRGEVEGELRLAAARYSRFRLRPGVQTGRPRHDVRRNDGRTEAWLEAWRQGGAVASRPRLPAFSPKIVWTPDEPVRQTASPDSASMSIGHSAWPNAPIAISIRHVRHQPVDQPRFAAAFCTRNGNDARPVPASARSPVFFSAAARPR